MTAEPNLITFAEPAIGDHARAGAAYALLAAASIAINASDDEHRLKPPPHNIWPATMTWAPLDPLRDLGRARDLIAQECAAEARRQRREAPAPARLQVVPVLSDLSATLARAEAGDPAAWQHVGELVAGLRERIELAFGIDLETLGPRR